MWMTQQCEMCNLKPLEVCCLLLQLLSARLLMYVYDKQLLF